MKRTYKYVEDLEEVPDPQTYENSPQGMRDWEILWEEMRNPDKETNFIDP